MDPTTAEETDLKPKTKTKRSRKTKPPKVNKFLALAKKYRPLKPKPLERVIREPVYRQRSLTYLHRSRGWAGTAFVSVTIIRLVTETKLTEKQVRSALDTLRKAGLIRFERQHNGKRGFGRSFYDCHPLVAVLYPPRLSDAEVQDQLADATPSISPTAAANPCTWTRWSPMTTC